MRGHTRKRGKTWTAIYDEGVNEQGDRRQIWRGGFKTKADAEQFLTGVLGELDKGTYVQPSKLTVSEYLTTWVETGSARTTRS
jgi:hypothetical protein